MWRASRRRGGRASSTRARSRSPTRFWPGPLTLVVPAASGASVCDLARAGLDSVALRVPAHPLAHALLERRRPARRGAVGEPLGPGQPDDRRACAGRPRRPHRRGARWRPDRRSGSNRRSSPASATPRLLRPGGVPREALEAALGRKLLGAARETGAPRAPGMLASHYAPRAKVRLDVDRVAPGEAVLLFGAFEPPGLAGGAGGPQPQPKRRPGRGRRSSLRASARARRERRRKHRRRADPGAWPRRGDQRPPAPRRRRRLIAILRGDLRRDYAGCADAAAKPGNRRAAGRSAKAPSPAST